MFVLRYAENFKLKDLTLGTILSMNNIFFIQLIGILVTIMGMVALTVSARLFGTPLTRDEKRRLGHENQNTYRLPINMETILSSILFIGGMGILSWSKFSLCAFLAYWAPNISDAIMFLLSCR